MSIRSVIAGEKTYSGCCPCQLMPHCENCDSFVTEQYVRVFAPQERDTVRVCPNCEDIIREGAGIREARSNRG